MSTPSLDNTLSQHLRPDVLEILRQEVPSHPGPLATMRDFYRRGWGVDGGKELGGVPYLAQSIVHPAGRGTENLVLVRDEYRILEASVQAQLQMAKNSTRSLTIYGSPGIGKTTALAYLASRLLEQRRPFVFLETVATYAHLFCDSGTYQVKADFAELRDDAFLEPFVVLADSTAGVIASLPKTILNHDNILVVLASSPRPERFSVLKKNAKCTFFTMEVWKEVEVAAASYLIHHAEAAKAAPSLPLPSLPPLFNGPVPPPASLPASDASPSVLPATATSPSAPSLSASSALGPSTPDEPQADLPLFLKPPLHYLPLPNLTNMYTPYELFTLMGPFARTVFSETVKTEKGPTTDFKCKEPFKVVGRIDDFHRALEGQDVDQSGQLHDFHKYFAIRPDLEADRLQTGNPQFSLSLETPFVRSFIHRSIRYFDLQEQLRIVGAVMNDPGMKGFVFENLALRFLSVARHSFPVKVGDKSYQTPHKMAVREWDPKDGLPSPLFPAPSLLLLPRAFASFDAVLVGGQEDPVFFLQVTTAAVHPVVPGGVREILTAWPALLARQLIGVFVSHQQVLAERLVKKTYPSFRGFIMVDASDGDDGEEGTSELIGKKRLRSRAQVGEQGTVRMRRQYELEKGYLVLDEGEVKNVMHVLEQQPPSPDLHQGGFDRSAGVGSSH